MYDIPAKNHTYVALVLSVYCMERGHYLLSEPSQLFLVDPCQVGEVGDISLEAVPEFFLVSRTVVFVVAHLS